LKRVTLHCGRLFFPGAVSRVLLRDKHGGIPLGVWFRGFRYESP
jgi:hypothetical protein